MEYQKPELVELGNATCVVEQSGIKNMFPADPAHSPGIVNPAYDPGEYAEAPCLPLL